MNCNVKRKKETTTATSYRNSESQRKREPRVCVCVCVYCWSPPRKFYSQAQSKCEWLCCSRALSAQHHNSSHPSIGLVFGYHRLLCKFACAIWFVCSLIVTTCRSHRKGFMALYLCFVSTEKSQSWQMLDLLMFCTTDIMQRLRTSIYVCDMHLRTGAERTFSRFICVWISSKIIGP